MTTTTISFTLSILLSFLIAFIPHAQADDPVQSFHWTVSYKLLSPLGQRQKVIVINGQFPGPVLETTTNNILYVTVHNMLDEPFLLTWNGLQQRKNPWQDGVLGTNCPIPPGRTWTYVVQPKDQIGSFFYYPTTMFQKAAGGFGGITIHNRDVISVPFDPPADDFTILIGDWYKSDHKSLRRLTEPLGHPAGILINGRGHHNPESFSVEKDQTYRLRISNVGITNTLNFRIQGHRLLLVETEGSYTAQTYYNSLDIHVGQSYSVLVRTNRTPKEYLMVAAARFTKPIYGFGILRYSGSITRARGTIHPREQSPWNYTFSMNQAKSIRWNLTAGAARPNPQGAYKYGNIPIVRTIILANSAHIWNGRLRYAVNGRSFVYPDTPLMLADYFGIRGVFSLTGFPDQPTRKRPMFYTSVVSSGFKNNNTEIIFQNYENRLQSWHLDGYNFFVVGMERGIWNPLYSRESYNLQDAVSRSTVQVYPHSWTAVLVQLDNKGIWNLRSQQLQRQYLGQELYIRVWNDINSTRDELPIPPNVLLCGQATNYKLP